jgi:hypothetical protein
VSSAYGNTCQTIENALPPFSTTCIAPTTIHDIPANAIPAVIRRSALGSYPRRRRAG